MCSDCSSKRWECLRKHVVNESTPRLMLTAMIHDIRLQDETSTKIAIKLKYTFEVLNSEFCFMCRQLHDIPIHTTEGGQACQRTGHVGNTCNSIYTGLFISPSGISELDCATTKTDTAERSISIGRESLQIFFVLGALVYFQVPPLGGSREEK